MWAIAVVLIVTALIIIIEVPSLLRKQLRKELWMFSILLLIGTGLSIAQSLQVDIPNPLDLLTIVYKPINDVVKGVLK
ncbi:hypothetical protein AM501_22015 [Aneurinibacillus migulanus]|uniref:Uncharacterized protein n=1 Tax=Aneurinibacillus migulanus TaxID=47500 RepID=A0A0D1VF38_ANEMI|nr:hypothetical protein [Aneurinibacillus migulanus]KIV54818.1 hypothetical protein TS65_18330 [Aneurinibacillus migulanus]KIV58059.1 hypothetical protein TS64_05825 [Aneurinibacillus migulanus]KON95544.1 hypothetical protein AF333_08715 [Aneurinibacillus migulanus]KPD06278.1 hypothetical protein AM501_22015 [Aneurinibacillus migulanus]MCP1355856.1 hypothetical protein [Aneurinibacillus migulanus]